MTSLSIKIKKYLDPFLEKGQKLNINWTSITEGFLKYADDPNYLISEIKKLGFEDTDEIMLKLPDLYETILDELAEEFINDNGSEIIDELKNGKSPLFQEKIKFYQLLKNVIIKLERERIIKELPNSYNKLTPDDDLDENNIEIAFKKKGREDLKNKFEKWDKELKETSTKPLGKIFTLSWVKFAVAASVVFGVGLTIFTLYNNFNQEYDIADLIIINDSTTIINNSGKGYTFSSSTSSTSSKKEYKINYIDQSDKIASLEKIIHKNEGGNLRKYKKELKSLILRDNNYILSDNELTLYLKKPKELFLIELEKKYFYIKLNTHFYRIKQTKEPLILNIEIDKSIIDKLEKILFYKL